MMEQLLTWRVRRLLHDPSLTLSRASAGHRRVFFVRCNGEPCAVLKLFLGHRTLLRQQRSLILFQQHDLPAPRPLQEDRSLLRWIAGCGNILVEEFVPGDMLREVVREPGAVRAAGRALARLHAVTREFPGRIEESGGKHLDEPWMSDRLRGQFDEFGGADSSVRSNAEEIRRRILEGFAGFPWGRPCSLCHMDMNLDNIIINQANGTNDAVFIDLQSARYHFFPYDLARLHHSIAEIAPDMAEELIHSYCGNGGPITVEDWERWRIAILSAYLVQAGAAAARRSMDPKRGRKREHYDRRRKRYSKELFRMLGMSRG